MRERVLVTGGAAGIGQAIAARCREDGYEAVVIDREGDGLRADLSDPDETARVLEQALRAGPITRLVNNVGVVRPGPVEEQSLEDLEQVVSLNLRCALQCLQALLPGMKDAGFGRVVNISSRAAIGKELRSVYAATKAGLQGFAKVWALELGQFGITANAIGPGPIRTALFDRVNPHNSPRTRAIIEAIPVRRVGTPEDVANAASFLLDARSGFVTGQVLYVCGGMTVGNAGAWRVLYHVRMEVRVPPGTDPTEFEALKAAEKARAQELQRAGKWPHLWRIAGRYANISVFDVASHDELHDLLSTLPLFPFLEIEVTPLARHPSAIGV